MPLAPWQQVTLDPSIGDAVRDLVGRAAVNRPNHYNLEDDLMPLIEQLGAGVVRAELEDFGFNYNAGPFDQTARHALAQLCVVAQKKPNV